MMLTLTGKHSQHGAAAIEAAVLFALFFTVFYAIVSYSLPMLMTQAFNHAAASGARAAVAIEPDAFNSNSDYLSQGVTPRVREVVGHTLSWLPQRARDAVLGADNGNVGVDYDSALRTLHVTVSYPGYRESPLIPVLRMPGIGEVPRLPEDLTGRAVVAL